MKTSTKEGKYIYCIIALDAAGGSGESKTFGPIGIGNRGDELHTICHKGIAAVVSDSPVIEYSVSRENMIPHEQAIEEVMKEYTVLPVRFGTISEDEGMVKKIIEREYDKFVDLLGAMEGKKEIGLKAIFKEDVIYKYILEKHENIRNIKEKISTLRPDKTYYQRMQIGEMVEAALGEEKEIHKNNILDTLSPLAQEVKENNTYGERMIINAAFLVENDREQEFDRKVNEIAETAGDKIKFKYVGTVPPFNFVNLAIETGRH